MRLTLLVPELIWSEPGDTEAQAPAAGSALAKILAQCHFRSRPNPGWESALRELAGLTADSSLAALRALGDGLAEARQDPACWLCADPVHLRFHQERLVLADASGIGLATDECAGLSERLNDALDGRGRIVFAGPTRAYLRLATPPTAPVDTLPTLSRKIGCVVRPTDFGADAGLRSLANEIQMLLHADPVNQAREASGRPPVNALWLWGNGQQPASRGKLGPGEEIDTLVGEHPLLRGIASVLGTSVAPTLPATTSHALVLLDALSHPAQYQDAMHYAECWRELDRLHLQPLTARLRRRKIRRADIVAPTVFGQLSWQLTPLSAWRGAFGRGSWASFLHRLAEQEPRQDAHR